MKPLAPRALAAPLLIALAAAGLVACTESPQAGATGGARKHDQKPWQQPVGKDFVVPGLKADDATAWEQQIRQRAQGQNEYLRTPAVAKP